MTDGPVKLLELYLIRHGQTVHNLGAASVFTDETPKGKHDPALTAQGLEQAKALGAFYSRYTFDHIYTSALERAITTADILRKGQDENKPLILKPDLAEIAIPHDYTGESFEALEKKYAPLLPADGYPTFPTVISDGQRDEKKIFERAAAVLSYFREKYTHGEKVAVVAHAALMTYMLFSLLGFDEASPPADFEINNTGVTKITFYQPGTFRDDVVVDYVNSTVHLPFVF